MRNPAGTKIILCAILAILTYSTFSTILKNDFIDYDDNLYITENPHVLSGLHWDSVKWAFQTTQTGNWIPLTWLSHILNVQLFDTNPGNHHRVDLILHCLNTILIFLIFQRTTGSFWASFLTALLFSIHPLRVESVAWVSERKDTLSTCFGLLSLLMYVSYAKNKKIAVYCLTCVFLIAGLMSKAMLVTWPFLFLLLDYWPLRRFDNGSFSWKKAAHLVIEKIPFLCVAFIFSVIAYRSQKIEGSVVEAIYYPLFFRIENVLISYVSYLKLIIFPGSLGVLYPIDPAAIRPIRALVCLFFVVCITFLFIWFRKQKPYLLIGWLWFIGILVPVVGLVQIGIQSMADRYTYVPSIGISAIVSFFAADLARRGRKTKVMVVTAAILICCTLILLTWIQTTYWKNSLTLYSHTLNVTKNNYIMHLNYGCALAKVNDFDDAMRQFQKAHELIPSAAFPFEKRAEVYRHNANYQEAANYLNQALTKRNPDRYDIFVNLADCYTKLNQPDLAIDYYNKALNIDHNSILCRNKLAMIYIDRKNPLYDPQKALDYAQQACRLTQFGDVDSMMTLIHILELNKDLEATLSKEFMDDLNTRIAELKKRNTPQ